eukprot:768058-Hanusia_phi.AAC.12
MLFPGSCVVVDGAGVWHTKLCNASAYALCATSNSDVNECAAVREGGERKRGRGRRGGSGGDRGRGAGQVEKEEEEGTEEEMVEREEEEETGNCSIDSQQGTDDCDSKSLCVDILGSYDCICDR